MAGEVDKHTHVVGGTGRLLPLSLTRFWVSPICLHHFCRLPLHHGSLARSCARGERRPPRLPAPLVAPCGTHTKRVIEERAELVHVVVVLDEAETTTVCGRAVALAKFSGAVEVERDIADRVGVFRRAEALGRALGAPSRVSGARGVHSYAARRRQTNSQKKHHNDDDDPLIKKELPQPKARGQNISLLGEQKQLGAVCSCISDVSVWLPDASGICELSRIFPSVI